MVHRIETLRGKSRERARTQSARRGNGWVKPEDAAKLLELQDQYPSHEIGRRIVGDRVMFYAFARANVGPHTIITDDLGELTRELEATKD